MCAIAGEKNEKTDLRSSRRMWKTFVYTPILNIIKGQGHIALAPAWTAIAVLLLDGGTTLHWLFNHPAKLSSFGPVCQIL